LDKNISLYNSAVMGMHNYYCMATMVSADFAAIQYRAMGKANAVNHNRRCIPLEREGTTCSKVIMERYGKSKQLRWMRDRVIVPAGYVSYVYPKYKRRYVNKYVRKYDDMENCVRFDVMKYIMEHAASYPTLEMADNTLSRYIAQKGRCAVTHELLAVHDMVCLYIKPVRGRRNDTYQNLILVSGDISNLILAENDKTISRCVKTLSLTDEMRDKINKLRIHRGLKGLQFEDYISTKK